VSISIPARRSRAPRAIVGPPYPVAANGAPRGGRRLAGGIFATGFILNLAAACILAYVWQIGNADALARTTNAFYVLFARDPHFASIGFIWPILPSFLQIPLLPLLHAVGHPEFAGPIVSAFFGAGLLVVLSAILGQCGVTGRTRLLWLALVQCNPLFWWLAASGLSEMPAMFFLTLGLYAFLRLSTGIQALLLLAFSLVGAFLIRYESLSSMAAFAAALVLQRWPVRPQAGTRDGWMTVQWRALRRDWDQLEGRLLVALAPAAYIIALWVLMNWMIMGDPLYFDHSVYSLAKAPDVARNYGPGHPLYHEMHNLPLTLGFAVWRNTQGNVLFPVVAVLALCIAAWRRDRQLLGLVVLTAGTFALSVYEIYAGTFPPYLRYWSLTTPFAVVLAGCVAARLAGTRWAAPFRWGASALLLLAVPVTLFGLTYGYGSIDEQRLGAYLLHNTGRYNYLKPADFYVVKEHDATLVSPALDRYSAKGLTMIDTETGFSAVLYAHHPERLVISPDRDFPALLANPRRGVRYIFATNPKLGRERDIIGVRYPGLFSGRLPWARQVGEVTGTTQPWRIFKIVPYGQPLPAPSPPSLPERYYFAGGAATPATRSTIALRNHGLTPASVQLTVYSTAGARKSATLRVAPGARVRVPIRLLAPSGGSFGLSVAADHPIAVRLQEPYTGATGDTVVGTQKLGTLWYLVEGYTNLTFKETVSLLNPGARPAHAVLHLLPTNGSFGRNVAVTVPPRANLAEDINALLPRRGVGVVVTADRPVMVERTMSFGHGPTTTIVAPGVKQAARTWRLRGGTTLQPAQTYVAILNPTGARAHLTVRLLDRAGKQLKRLTIVAAPGGRVTVTLHREVHAGDITSVITSDQPVVVEQTVYHEPPNGPM